MRAAEVVLCLFVYRYLCKFTKQLSQRRQPRQAHERVEAVVAPLAQLIEAAYKEAGVTPPDALPLLAFGFSKAGIVLNQLLAEAAGVVDGDDDDGKL